MPFGESSATDKQEACPSKHHAPIATVWGMIPYLCALTERRDSTCVSGSLSGSDDLESVLVDDLRDAGLFRLFFIGALEWGDAPESSSSFAIFCTLSESLGLGGGSLKWVTDSALNLRPFRSRDLSLRVRPRPPKPLGGTGRTESSLRKRLGGPCSTSVDGGGRASLFNGRMGGLSWGRGCGGNLADESEEGGPAFHEGDLKGGRKCGFPPSWCAHSGTWCPGLSLSRSLPSSPCCFRGSLSADHLHTHHKQYKHVGYNASFQETDDFFGGCESVFNFYYAPTLLNAKTLLVPVLIFINASKWHKTFSPHWLGDFTKDLKSA